MSATAEAVRQNLRMEFLESTVGILSMNSLLVFANLWPEVIHNFNDFPFIRTFIGLGKPVPIIFSYFLED
ncbi:MAG: hypothetical protein WBK55_06495 [Alphaproteobacteria bacterium]